MIYLMFTRRKAFFSRWIQQFTWSRWSHVAMVYNGAAIESMMFKGVVKRPVDEAVREYSDTLLQRIETNDPEAIWLAACSQVGKGYDYMSIFGLFFRRDWQADDSWQCAELLAWACEKGGTPLLRAERFNRVAPQHLLMSVKLGN